MYKTLIKVFLGFVAIIGFIQTFDIEINPGVFFSLVIKIAKLVPPYFLTSRFWILVGVLYAVLIIIRDFPYRKYPITLLSNQITLIFDQPDGSLVRINRQQELRANREDVTGFFQTLNAGDKGQIQRNNCSFHIHYPGFTFLKLPLIPLYKPKEELHFEGNERAWRILHEVDPSLPRCWWILNLNKIFRTATSHHYNQFVDPDEESYEVLTQSYIHHKLTVTVYFHPERPMDFSQCKALRIVDSGIIREDLEEIPPGTDNRTGIRVTIKNSKNERLKIVWKYKIPDQNPKASA